MSYNYKKNYSKESDLDRFLKTMALILILWIYAKTLELYNTHPIIFIIISLLFFWLWVYIFIYYKKIEETKLMNIKTIEDMKKLEWREFEKFIEFVFRKKWFKATVRKWRNDWWIDLDAELDWQKYLVQCKKWNNYRIWAVQLREFYWVVKMMWDKYKWIYITTSSLTREARKEYENIKHQVDLWDNSNLEEYINDFKWLEIWEKVIKEQSTKETLNEKHLICEKCWWEMLLRKAKRWDHKWEKFYWCSNYPKCKNIIKIS